MQLTKRQDGEGISPDSSLGRSIIPPEAHEMQQHAFLGLEIQGDDSDEDERSRSSAVKSSIEHRRASLYQENSTE